MISVSYKIELDYGGKEVLSGVKELFKIMVKTFIMSYRESIYIVRRRAELLSILENVNV